MVLAGNRLVSAERTSYALQAMRAGQVLEGYALERRVGVGSFSEVWSARRGAEAPVALKLLASSSPPQARARLAREVQALAVVRHPRVVALLGELHDVDGLVLELLGGPSLADAELPLAPLEAITLVEGLFDALVVVHRAGIVHRDVSPANVVLHGEPGQGKLIDFGMAKLRDAPLVGDEKLTSADATLGTLMHAAPEQLEDPRFVTSGADVYALGSTLFAALAGRAPFRAPNAASLIALKVTRSAPSLGEVSARGWPPALEDLLRRTLARDAASRPSAEEAASVLGRIREELSRA